MDSTDCIQLLYKQTVQTQIRLLLKEQSDQGLHSLQFFQHLLEVALYDRGMDFKFRMIRVNC